MAGRAAVLETCTQEFKKGNSASLGEACKLVVQYRVRGAGSQGPELPLNQADASPFDLLTSVRTS
jgi:hypothetical protein